jgi:alkylhydroperoxidase family enzyme
MAADDVVIGVLGSVCRRMWGFTPRMIPMFVERMGARQAAAWFAANMPRYLYCLHVLGPVRTHLACIAISLRNGCSYCAFGHAYALELVYLRDRDRLFPLGAATIATWLEMDARRLRRRLRDVLQRAGLHAEAIWVDRTLDLAEGARPADRNEARIADLVQIVGTMNSIAVAGQAEPDEAHDTVNKDTALKARHSAMWATTT